MAAQLGCRQDERQSNNRQQKYSENAYAIAHGSPPDGSRKGAHEFSRMLVSDREVAEMIGASRASVWRDVARGLIPAPIKFAGRTRWVLAEVEAAIAKRMADRDGKAA